MLEAMRATLVLVLGGIGAWLVLAWIVSGPLTEVVVMSDVEVRLAGEYPPKTYPGFPFRSFRHELKAVWRPAAWVTLLVWISAVCSKREWARGAVAAVLPVAACAASVLIEPNEPVFESPAARPNWSQISADAEGHGWTQDPPATARAPLWKYLGWGATVLPFALSDLLLRRHAIWLRLLVLLPLTMVGWEGTWFIAGGLWMPAVMILWWLWSLPLVLAWLFVPPPVAAAASSPRVGDEPLGEGAPPG